MQKATSGQSDGEVTACLTLVYLGMMYQLNLLGGEIWKRCDGEHDLSAIVDELADKFEGPKKTIMEDARFFIEDLINKGLLVEG